MVWTQALRSHILHLRETCSVLAIELSTCQYYPLNADNAPDKSICLSPLLSYSGFFTRTKQGNVWCMHRERMSVQNWEMPPWLCTGLLFLWHPITLKLGKPESFHSEYGSDRLSTQFNGVTHFLTCGHYKTFFINSATPRKAKLGFSFLAALTGDH